MTRAALPRRRAVVDLGSNSVRLVVFEGEERNPTAIFNERANLRLGRGLTATGRLDPTATAQALTVLDRYAMLARAMRADPFAVLATAAVRDAANGPEFVRRVETLLPGVPVTVLSGEAEAGLSADGLLCGLPDADGVLADIGGGSLELVRVAAGHATPGRTLRLGVIRLAERANGDLGLAREIADAELRQQPVLAQAGGRDLYLVGGTFRALARLSLTLSRHPLTMVQAYAIPPEAARELTTMVLGPARDRLPGVPRRRAEDLPYAATVLRRLLRLGQPRRVVFSAMGLREGWYYRGLPDSVRARDPMLDGARGIATMLGRDAELPPALCAWTKPLFPSESAAAHRLREAACWLSDIGSHDHPEYRAEQAFYRVLRQPGGGLNHADRAFLALTVALRYEVETDAPFLQGVLEPGRSLLPVEAARQAGILGAALRLAYTLSGGTPAVLAGALLDWNGVLTLRLRRGAGVFSGDSVTRRLERLGAALGARSVTTET